MNKFISYLNTFSLLIVGYLVARYIYLAFFINNYEVLFIDERIIINDIYNVWNLDNEFNRYSSIENNFFKNLLLVFTEFSYGGDLRYGRIWSNIFIILLGPISFFSDQALITSVRIFTIFIYFISINLLINFFLDKEYRWIYNLIFYSIPGVFYFNTSPKPDIFVILFIAFAIKLLLREQYFKSIILLGIATGVKIVGIFPLIFLTLYLFINKKLALNPKNIIKSLASSWVGLVIANPILIIPPINVGNLPNFYSIYYNWLNTQSLVSQNQRFSFEYFLTWSRTLSSHFSYGLVKNELLSLLIILVFFVIIFSLINKKDYLIALLSISGLIHLLFIFISVERQWKVYLNFSFILIFVGVIYYILNFTTEPKKMIIIFYFLIVPINFLGVSERFVNYSTKPSSDLLIIPEVIDLIEDLYEQKIETKNIVLWDPSYGMPRNNVTYSSFFDVRENWDGDELETILQNSDFYVSKKDITSGNYKVYKIKDFYIYTNNS
tara:strand:- start:11723 stop:13204 length:1482 start_codon:yes stop_codon:yes gene_type:complete